MNQLSPLPLREILKNYDALIFDIWGVLYDGVGPYPGVVAFLNDIIDIGKRVIFLSNNPRPSDIISGKFADMGVNMEKAKVYTSGDAFREQLISWDDEVFQNLGKKCYHLGADRNQDILRDMKIDLTDDINQADFLLITAFINENEDLKMHDDLLQKAVKLNIPGICPNPDLTAHQVDKIIYCPGTFSKRYEAMGGVVHYYGKPALRMFNSVINKHLSDLDRSRILMIGDTIDTDILGANRAEIHSALVLTGNGEEIAAKLSAGEKDIFKNCQAKPTWITDGVK